MALIINERALFWYLMPLNLFVILFVNFRQKKQNVFQTIKKLIIIVLSTIFFMHLSHPYLFKHPITGIWDIIDTARHGYPFGAAVLFDGIFYQAGVNPLPWYYLPKMLLITLPLMTLILFIIGHTRLINLIWKKKEKLIYSYVLIIFYTPLLLVFLLKPTLYDSWRQFLFLTVPLVIIATYGLNVLMGLAHKFLPLKIIITLIIIIWSAGIVFEMIRLHPYEYIYYNSLVGGLKGAYGKYETDYLGLSYKEATLWFINHVNNPQRLYKILVEGDPLSSSTYFKHNMLLTTNESEADYIFTFTRWNLHLKHEGTTMHIVEKEGVPLVFIKQLQGIK